MEKYISINSDFQYSVNLKYDIQNKNKVNNYILTDSAMNLFNKILKNINEGKDNANILIGPYGKGKSHLMLVLLSLIKSNSFKGLDKLINKLANNYPKVYNEVKKLESKKLLPIVVNSGYDNIQNSILLSINNVLKDNNLDYILPETNFSVAIKTIDKWFANSNAIKRVNSFLKKTKYQNIQELKQKLINQSEEAYKIFNSVFEKVTYGTKFNPFIDVDLEKIILSINQSIKTDSNYDGIYIILDEFSKFIEGNIDKNVSNDLLLLQSLAERGSRKKDLFLTCITHKPISEYIYKLPKNKIDQWKAISGRFSEYNFTSSSRGNYQLIKNAILKNKNWKEEYSDLVDKSKEILMEAHDDGLFEMNEKSHKDIYEGCFPLNPFTVLSLIRVSEKVAQNERTLFTFLAKEEKYTLYDFINRGKVSLMNIDWVYDYFKIVLKNETYNKRIYNLWLKASTSIRSVDNEVQKKVIKALAVINIVNESRFKPSINTISNSLTEKKKEVKKAVNILVEKKILINNYSNKTIRFSLSTNINVKKKIEKVVNTKIKKIDYCLELENMINEEYEVPKTYNYDMKMTRFFKYKFLKISNLEKIDMDSFTSRDYADGLIINVLNDIELNRKEIINKLKSIKFNNLVIYNVAVNKFEIEELLKKVLAIKKIRKNKKLIKGNLAFQKELIIYLEELNKNIQKKYKNSYRNFDKNIIFYKNECSKIDNRIDFNRKISDICKKIYFKTPKINNEMINKRKISSIIKRARNDIINHILKDYNSNFDSSGNSASSTIYRILILNKGLEGKTKSNDKKLNDCLNEIEKYILESEEKKNSFKKLYNRLEKQPYGIRRGIIPIYLVIVFNKYIDKSVIYFDNTELSIDLEIINKINKRPELYSLYVDKGTREKEKYLENIIRLFGKNNIDKIEGKNRYKNIIDLMQSYVRGLPKYSRNTKVYYKNNSKNKIDRKFIRLKDKLLSFDINNYEFLFQELPKGIFKNKSYNEIIKELEDFIKLYDNLIRDIKEKVIELLESTILDDLKGSFGSKIKEWGEKNDEALIYSTKDSLAIKLYKYTREIENYNEYLIIDRIAKIISGYRIEDWSDNTIDNFINKINEIQDKIKKSSNKEVNLEGNVEIMFNDKKLVIPDLPIEGISRDLYQELEIIFDEFSYSIDDLEMKNVLVKILKKLEEGV